jgi:hypothetical protein
MVGLGNWCSWNLLSGPKRLYGGMCGRIRCSDSVNSWSREVLSLAQRFKEIGRTEIHKPDEIKLSSDFETTLLKGIKRDIEIVIHPWALYLVVALDGFQYSHIRRVVVILIYSSSGANRWPSTKKCCTK